MNLTPTQQRIIDILADGLPHNRKEVLKAISEDATDLNGLAVHMWHLRRKVRPFGRDIITELHRGSISYRHVILLSGKDPQGLDPF